jgi:hypothetical protein
MSLRENSDKGTPLANFTDNSPRGRQLAQDLESLVSNLEAQVGLASLQSGSKTPTLTIS